MGQSESRVGRSEGGLLGEDATYKLWRRGRGLKGATACKSLAMRKSVAESGTAYRHICDSGRSLFGAGKGGKVGECDAEVDWW